jgi:8-oxo-dGTP diphosphatase
MKNRVRAIIIKENKVLIIKRTKKDSVYYVIPGGGVENGEDFEVAIRRECKEELGVDVRVKELFAEIISGKLETVGQKEYFYICEIINGELGTGQGPEYIDNNGYEGAYNLLWIDIDSLSKIDLRPNILRDKIIKLK